MILENPFFTHTYTFKVLILIKVSFFLYINYVNINAKIKIDENIWYPISFLGQPECVESEMKILFYG